MNVQVLSIEPTNQIRTFDVLVKIGNDECKFTMTVKIAPVADRAIQVTNGDDYFLETFRFYPMVALEISKLVSKLYNHQAIQLPVNIGELKTGEVSQAR